MSEKWTAEHDMDGDWAIFEGSRLVAVTNSDTPWDEANAKLICASKALAEALRELLDAIALSDGAEWDAAIEKAEAALSASGALGE